MKPKDISVSVYILDGKPKAIIQMSLPDIAFERDEHNLVKDSAKHALQKAMRDALSEWELNV